MSEFKSEVLPSGVLIRKVKGDDNIFVLSNMGQAVIVSKLDIARMDGIIYPTRRLSERCGIQSDIDKPIDTERAWNNVSQKLTLQHANTSAAYEAEVRRIAEILHNKYWEYDGQEVPLFEDENTHPELWDQARAMVAEMAKQFESGYDVWLKHQHHSKGEHEIMILHGLIPASAQEGGENGK